MFSNARLGKEFWDKAIVYVCYLINHCSLAAIEGKTLIEMWTSKPITDYDYFNVFYYATYYHVKKSKFDPRVKKVLFIGIIGGVKGYRLWCPITNKIIFSRNMTFDVSAMLKQKYSQKDDDTTQCYYS